MQTESKLVKKNSAGALSTINPRDFAGRGAEEISSDDKSTPILKILHQLSPECNSKDSKYVEGSKPGMIYAKSFGKLIDGEDGINVVVAHTQMRFPEWQERGDSASAPVATHLILPADAREERNGRYRLPNGNYVEKTAYFYVLALVDGDVRPAIIPMRSSNLSPARELNDFIANGKMSDAEGMFPAPSFAFVYNLKTVGKQAGSKSWHVYKPTKVRPLDLGKEADTNLWILAAEMQKSAVKGTTKPKYEESNQTQDII